MNQRHVQGIGIAYIVIGVCYFIFWMLSSAFDAAILSSDYESIENLSLIYYVLFSTCIGLFFIAGISLCIKRFQLEFSMRSCGLALIVVAVCLGSHIAIDLIFQPHGPPSYMRPVRIISNTLADAHIVLAGVAWLVSKSIGYKRFAGIMLVIAGAISQIIDLVIWDEKLVILSMGMTGMILWTLRSMVFIAAGVVSTLPAFQARDKQAS